MKIALDIDGVLLDFDTHWRTFAIAHLERELPKLNSDYDLGTRYGVTKKESDSVWAAFYDQEKWASILPYPCALESVPRLHDSHHDLFCVTAAPEDVETQRRISLQALELEDKLIEFTGYHHEGNTKHEALSRHQPDVFVDDQLINLLHAQESGINHRIWIDRGDAQMHVKNAQDWSEIATLKITTLNSLPTAIERIDKIHRKNGSNFKVA